MEPGLVQVERRTTRVHQRGVGSLKEKVSGIYIFFRFRGDLFILN